MSICFVIQPFDGGEFDDRYDDIFVPAIKEAGLNPYRVDKDPGVNIVIEDIESKIKESALCLADITSSNPNVWYEVGYATASNKDVVLVCSEEVVKFPFDIQHKKIIRYKKGSPRDFLVFQKAITERIKALLSKERVIENLSTSPIKETEGLSQHEIIALVSIMQNRDSPDDAIYTAAIHNDMERAGSNKLASNLALTTLLRKGMIKTVKDEDFNGNSIFTYSLMDKGEDWLITNQNKLNLRQNKLHNNENKKTSAIFDDEIPF